MRAEIQEAARMIVGAAADAIYADSHQFQNRPCQTCRVITGLLGFDFGCVRKQEEVAKGVLR